MSWTHLVQNGVYWPDLVNTASNMRGNFFTNRGILCFSKRFAPWSEFQERVDLYGVKNDVDSRQRTLLISKAGLSFPEYSKNADKSPKQIEKDLFCLSAVSRYRALTFFLYLHDSIFRDTRKGYLRVKGESKANSFYEVYFHLLDRQDKLLHMTPRIVMTPH